MKLQLAVDLVDTKQAMCILAKVHDVIDIIEIGTPMIVREGMQPVRIVKNAYPKMTVLADLKIIDGGSLEAAYAYEAGADIVTVLAAAYDETIKAAITEAQLFERKILCDMIAVKDIVRRASEIDALGVDYICIHTGVDVQKSGQSPYCDFLKIKPVVRCSKTALAGGIRAENMMQVMQMAPDIVIVGSAITGAKDIRKVALEIRMHIDRGTG